MGFRTGAYAKVWEVTPMSDTSTKIRMSVSRKNPQTNEFEQTFSGFVLCIGTAAARNAAKLKEGSRIKIGDCDVTTKYDSQKKITYTNFKTSFPAPAYAIWAAIYFPVSARSSLPSTMFMSIRWRIAAYACSRSF